MARPKKPKGEKKDVVLTIRLTADKIKHLDELAARIEASSGFPISRTAVATRLMDLGQPILEREYPVRRK